MRLRFRSPRLNRLAFVGILGLLPFVVAPPAHALDVGPWDAVLRAHVHGGRVDYAALAADAEGRAALTRFLAEAGEMPEDAGLASWLNVYNALVVAQVIEHYPIASVREVPGFFDRARFRVAGAERTLDAIENEIIRPRFRDARVHFALNCGARSCPRLAARAFRPQRLDTTLERLARAGVAAHVSPAGPEGGVRVSRIFEWFAADFERDAGSVRAWIRRYGGETWATLPDDAPIAYRAYDWRLNDTRRAPRSD